VPQRKTRGGIIMGIMGLIWTIIVGLIVGAIARWIMPGAQTMGWLLTSLLGIGGSIVGGFISSLIWKTPDGRFHPAGWVLSIIGALLLLWAYNAFMK
jgi:uncharacterized membrane protein YeaQ/YmgE (transglycosylase-associated protein family)